VPGCTDDSAYQFNEAAELAYFGAKYCILRRYSRRFNRIFRYLF